jgi:hypothetical protein
VSQLKQTHSRFADHGAATSLIAQSDFLAGPNQFAVNSRHIWVADPRIAFIAPADQKWLVLNQRKSLASSGAFECVNFKLHDLDFCRTSSGGKNGFRRVKAVTVCSPYHPRQELDWQLIHATSYR